MKRCPECRRDYYDDTLLYCLDDGNALLEGPAFGVPPSGGSSMDSRDDEPATAILSEPGAIATGFPASESPTRAQVHTTDQTAIFPRGAEAEPQENSGGLSERQSLSANRAAEPPGKVGSRQRQLAVFAIATVLLVAGFFGYRYFTPTKQIESIAVMPFVNDSGNADVEYLSDGMTETLISSLSQLPNLNVKARSSVFRYKGKEIDAKTIGKDLNVQAILNGRVVQRGDRLTLGLELIDTQTENILWSGQYERKPTDLVSLQTEITRDVLEKLKIRLSGSDQAKLVKTYSQNVEAYELYLRGRFQFSTYTESGFRNGITFFQKAIAIDPDYALAYSGLADCYFGLSDQYEPARDMLPKMAAAAEKAVELDGSLAEVHASLGLVRMYKDRDWRAAESQFTQAISLDPEYANAHLFYARMLSWLGRSDEAIREGERAVELDPFSAPTKANVGLFLLLAKRHQDAIRALQDTIQNAPNTASAHLYLALTLLQLGEHQMAIQAAEKATEIDAGPRYLGSLGYLYAATGHRDKALRIIDQLDAMKQKRHVSSYYPAAIHAGLGEKDQAFVYLEKAYAEGSDPLPGIRVFPFFTGLRDDPRFKDLLKRMNLPE